MNIIFIDCKKINSKSKIVCYWYKKYGFWIKRYKVEIYILYLLIRIVILVIN